MKIGDLLKEGQIVTGFQARDKWEAITKLVDLLISQGRLKAEQRDPVYAALAAREKIASTGMEHGVAIPHASVDGVATECGMARGDPARLPALLAAHVRLAETAA